MQIIDAKSHRVSNYSLKPNPQCALCFLFLAFCHCLPFVFLLLVSSFSARENKVDELRKKQKI